MFKLIVLMFYLVAGLGWYAVAAEPAKSIEKHRLVVLTDIEADPDDTQSLIRLLLYSNQIDIEGLIATTSVHQKHRVAPESIQRLIGLYGQVQPNLLLHQADFPTAASLAALVKEGQKGYGMSAVGAGKASQGSDWLLQQLELNDPRPLWVSVWGGANTLAQALYQLKQKYSQEKVRALVGKLRVYAISDQDDSGFWLRKNFPNLFYIVSPGGYGAASWMGINEVVQGADNTSISNSWLAQHIQQGHGPLGAAYPDVAYAMEGDTPAFLSLIPNGLNTALKPDWGGWGGRYQLYIPDKAATDPDGFNGGIAVEQEPRPIWTNAVDSYKPILAADYGRASRSLEQSISSYRATISRWRDDIQHDFAARMDWTIQPYDKANHAPEVRLRHANTIEAQFGQGFELDASASVDPDGDSLSYYWFVYPEAGTAQVEISMNAENQSHIYVNLANKGKAGSLHFIVRVTDKGQPALSRYQRVVVLVQPQQGN